MSSSTIANQKAHFPWRRVSAIAVLLFFAPFLIRAERLPVKQYTVADGLAQGTVWAMHQDTRGFLWLATNDGLSRFDGYRFNNYGINDGLGHPQILDVVSDRRGRLWVATGKGVSMLLDETEAMREGKKFRNLLLATGRVSEDINAVHRIFFDADNRLWCVTDVGFYRATSLNVAAGQFEAVGTVESPNAIPVLFQDWRGRLWTSGNDRLFRIEQGQVTKYELWREAGETAGDADYRWIKGAVELENGRIVLATGKDLYEFIEPVSANQRGAWRKLPLMLAPRQSIGAIHRAAGGGIWIGTEFGLIRYRDGQQVAYRVGNSPNPFTFQNFLTDRDGNLWIGTRHTGLLKLTGEAVVVYDASDGLLPVMEVYWLRETQDARMILFGRPVSRFGCNDTFLTNDSAGRKGVLDHLQMPPNLCAHDLAQDGRQNWWILRWLPEKKTYRVRFIPGPKLNPTAGYELAAADGWVDGGYSTMYQDSEGHIWFRNLAQQVFRVEYADNGHPRVREMLKSEATIYMNRSPDGVLWFTDGGSVFRHRNGRVETVRVHGENTNQSVRNFFFDSQGRLWICTLRYGVFVTETPNADQPRFVNYNDDNGLAAKYVESICEGDDGRIWFGTGRGLDFLDTATGRISHFSFNDDSIGSVVRDLRKDGGGNIWASVLGAVIRINPRLLPRASQQLPVFFNRIRIAGESLPMAETGISNIVTPELPLSRNNITIEFLSPNFRGPNALRYQFKLEGADKDWSVPENQREVNYANLSPGNYRFLAQALDNTGIVNAEPASLRFTILRPVWQRWWFLAALISGLGALVYGGYRYRLGQAIKVERVRTRIAHDLHDDIGANLTRISILSEVAKQQQGNGASPPGELPAGLLDSIAEISRESVAAMNDIVWAINPEHDSLLDLTSRMRRHAEEVFTTRDIRLEFEAPGDAGQLKLEIETRRDLYLIFKEAVNNAARHAACSAVSIQIQASATHIQLTVRDNGKGFDPRTPDKIHSEGNGLLSMRNRARALGGKLTIESSPGAGSEVRLMLPFSPA